MQARYRTQFVGNDGTQWRIDILDADTSVISITDFRLAYENGAVIEWNETAKTDAVASSSLTLRILSTADRQWTGLYRTEVGILRADVFRNGTLYWSGTLDTELYEEPYSYNRDYEVEVTFSDFAILERQKFEATGVVSLQDIIDQCVTRSGINHAGIEEMIALRRSADEPLDLDDIYINTDNFREDGEPQNLREVIEAVLTPLGLRIQQKAGHIWLYDLQGLFENAESRQINWMGDDASLGVDKTFSDVIVSFSAGSSKELADCSLQHNDILKDETNYWSFNLDTAHTDNLEGFRIFTGTQDGLPFEILNGAKLFRIDSVYSGSDEAGVVWNFKGGSSAGQGERDVWRLENGAPGAAGASNNAIINWSGMIGTIRSNPTPGHRTSAVFSPARYRLRVLLSVLFDPRYNPFESDDNDNNYKSNYKKLKDYANFAYVPFRLLLKDSEGTIIYHYENHEVVNSGHYKVATLGSATGSGWVAGDPGNDWTLSWLAYYDFEDRKDATGLGGWKTNRQAIGVFTGKLPRVFEKREDGEYIDLPPVGGSLVLEIGKGIIIHNDNGTTKQVLYDTARWMLYKDLKIEIVSIDGTDIELVDFEDKAWIDRNAKEELSINTTVGTVDGFIPSARGALLNEDYTAVETLYRAGYDDRVERLLIASIFSQYASRHTSLSGTADLIPEFNLLTDSASPLLTLVPLAETQDLIQNTSQITAVELTAENYAAVDWDNDNQQT